MDEAEGNFLSATMILAIIFVIVFQLLNHPRISIIGCVLMTIVMSLFMTLVGNANNNIWGVTYTFAGGFGIFVIALVLMYVAGCAPKKK